jgi:serine/threonine protein phosphatase 1
MAGRVIAIGDIHGCSLALRALVDSIGPNKNDTLVTLGDYCDRGPDTRGVIDYLIELRSRCNLVTLYGNHEEMMREVIIEEQPPFDWLRHGGVDTLDSYGFVGDLRAIPKTHREFLEGLVDYFRTDTHFFVHANYDANLEFDEQPPDLLRWIKLTESVPKPHKSGLRAIVGHTHDRNGLILDLPHLVCLDTYCYGGLWLTAMDVESGEVWQTAADGSVRQPDAVRDGGSSKSD